MKITRLDAQNVQDGGSEVLVTDSKLVNLWTLGIANDETGTYTTHIVFNGTPDEAHRLFDNLFHNYVDGCCQNLGCDAQVMYIVGKKVIKTALYGWDETNYTMKFMVYCDGNASAILAELKTDLIPGGISIIVVEPSILYGNSCVVNIITD